MGKKKREEMSFVKKVLKFQHAGLNANRYLNRATDTEETVDINKTIKRLFSIAGGDASKPGNMIFFVMYDIESNKVRTEVAKYLEKKGCTRIQRSIFLADLERSVFDVIRSDLAEVQSCYENQDSIILVPISTDYLQSMKVIGKTINVDIITKTVNTLFF
ncbi:MAG: CRISPR-associated endoribonuclease Cas2 [Bacteroidetes bacterium ADurb.Bin416]|jgi:CRISPR-associated protein Cas2|nr:MAG: CRISPR-associated endoribonuclease Cas2 [Bacteroidetes bacterium ADurb.Bin416]